MRSNEKSKLPIEIMKGMLIVRQSYNMGMASSIFKSEKTKIFSRDFFI